MRSSIYGEETGKEDLDSKLGTLVHLVWIDEKVPSLYTSPVQTMRTKGSGKVRGGGV